MDIMPEAVILFGAAIVGWVVQGFKEWRHPPRIAVIGIAFAVGLAVSATLYLSGTVDVGEATTVQIGARSVLAGVTMAMAASGGQAQYQTIRRARADVDDEERNA
jgi:O-antigen ligase